MTSYLLRRGLAGAWTMLGISLVVFTLVRLAGDPVTVLLPPEASPEQREALRADLGLDEPLPGQYARFLRHAATGDFGDSFRFNESASALFWQRFGATLELAAAAAAVALGGGCTVGLLSALYAGSLPGRVLLAAAYTAQAIPSFVAAMFLVTIFSVELGWLPSAGKGGIDTFVIPSTSLALFSFAAIARLVRMTAMETLRSDFVRSARMKGLAERVVVTRHVLPHALMPVVSIFSIHLAFFLGGSVVIETIFAWPGIGQLAVQSILSRDYALVQAIVFFTSLGVVLIGLLLDAIYVVLDPRLRRA